MNDEVVKIRYKLSYRIEMTGLALFFGALVLFILSLGPSERLYCISDKIIDLIVSMVVLGIILFIFYLAACSLYDCIIINGKNITIRSFLHRTVTGDSYIVRKYRITKKKKKELSNEDTIDITCDDSEISMYTKELTPNYTVLVDYLQNYCRGHRRANSSNTQSKQVEEVKDTEDDYIEKWGLRVPSKVLHRYITISRLILEIGLLSYIFGIQFVIENPLNILFWLTVIMYSWLIIRFVFWQDAALGFWTGPNVEEKKSKNKKLEKIKYFLRWFIVTPILGLIFLYMRADTAFEKFHIYQLGNMNKAIILFSVGIWFAAIILKNLFYGKNTVSIKVNLIRQILFLFIIVLLGGHVIYGVSLLYNPECHIEKAEVIDKDVIHHRRGGYDYSIDVVYEDGIEDTFWVWESTYDGAEVWEDIDIAVYKTVFGSEYRHLVEPGE